MLCTTGTSDPSISIWVFLGTLGGILLSAVIRKYVSIFFDRNEAARKAKKDDDDSVIKQLNLARAAVEEIEPAVVNALRSVDRQERIAAGLSPIVLYSATATNIRFEAFELTMIRLQSISGNLCPSLNSAAETLRSTGYQNINSGVLAECAVLLKTLDMLAERLKSGNPKDYSDIDKHLDYVHKLEEYTSTLKILRKQLLKSRQYIDFALKNKQQ